MISQRTKSDWFLMRFDVENHGPRSFYDGQRWAREYLAPLMAAVCLYSGRATGDLDDLTHLVSGEPLKCDACDQPLAKGTGHAQDCALLQQAHEVMKNPPMNEREDLLAREQKLHGQLAKIVKRLRSIGERP